MSAVSKKLRPASMQMSTILRASAMSSVAPHASKNSSRPPKVPQPKQSSGTLRPERPSCRYSMGIGCHEEGVDAELNDRPRQFTEILSVCSIMRSEEHTSELQSLR